jgi:hypothetical protein
MKYNWPRKHTERKKEKGVRKRGQSPFMIKKGEKGRKRGQSPFMIEINVAGIETIVQPDSVADAVRQESVALVTIQPPMLSI